MKKQLLTICMLVCAYALQAQCAVDSYITNNYTKDAKLLALREILSDANDPDYNNPEIPESRYQPYLEDLSVLYTNADNLAVADSMFVEFEMHVNPLYTEPLPYKIITFNVPTATSWVADLKTTGISNITTLDNLIATYNLTITQYHDVASSESTNFRLESLDVLNITALIDDFEAIEDINYAGTDFNYNDLYNYTGIDYDLPYTFSYTMDVELTDISYDETTNTYTFRLGGGDCMLGCMAGKLFSFEINDNCTFTSLAIDDNFEFASLAIYPNPVSNYFTVKNSTPVTTVTIYNVNSVLIKETNQTDYIDTTNLANGIYFVKITGDSGNSITKKLVKI